jgi:endonuclease G
VSWFDETGELRTTCYTLHQKNLVKDIDFEALRLDELFVDEQRSVAFIEEVTGLIFPKIFHETDTYIAS